MSSVEKFLLGYEREYDYYHEVARLCAQQCEAGLEQSGLRAIVTFRAKRPDRVREKLEKRNLEKKYRSVDQIRKDVVDLAGVRIALYFPGDRAEVRDFIQKQFVVERERKFPDESRAPTHEKRFSGYWADHYGVHLKEVTLSETQRRYAQAQVEVQVASVLMHAWAEVEHDLAYKPTSGELSEDEYAILDELNGIVLAGEIALERLQRAVKVRANKRGQEFGNHYELATWLSQRVAPEESPLYMGRADILLKFLESVKLGLPEKLEPYVDELDSDTERRPLVEQVVDRLLADKPDYIREYLQAKRQVGKRNPYALSDEPPVSESYETALGYFISRWVAFESVSRALLDPNGSRTYLGPISQIPKHLAAKGYIGPELVPELARLNFVRNDVVHGLRLHPETEFLVEAGKRIDTILAVLRDKTPEELSSRVDRILKESAPEPRDQKKRRMALENPDVATA